MSLRAAPICIQCGQATTQGASDHLNRLPDGRPCAACAERLLATLPPLLPGMPVFAEEPEFEGSEPDHDRSA